MELHEHASPHTQHQQVNHDRANADDNVEDGLGCFVNYVSYIMYKAATEKISSLRESTSPSFILLRPQKVLRDQDQPRELIA